MKSKEDTTPSPETAELSDMQTNDDERTESRERARGKRRTAREIASMFEQLKQRHIARKKEWQEEKQDLMKRVETADESKRVLAELKTILENLREELRSEGGKRIEMEAQYFAEKRQWETEKAELLRNLEESAYESDKGEKDMKKMAEKLARQSKQLSEWQATVLQLKKESLEIENRFLRDKRELQLELEKERSSWKKRENELLDRIRQLDTKSSTSSTSPTRIAADVVKDFINMEDYVGNKAPSSTSAADARKYSSFQKTVDDALKQIEKINTDLEENPKPRQESDSYQFLVASDNSAAPSPQPLGRNTVQMKSVPDSSPSINAPWRTKHRSLISNHSFGDNSLSPEDKFSPVTHSDSPVDVSISLPSIKVTHRLSPNPDRKVRKISGQGSQIDIAVSSPDTPTQVTAGKNRYFPADDQITPGSTSPQKYVAESLTQGSKNARQNDRFQSANPSVKKSPALSRQRKVDFVDDTAEQSDPPNVKSQSAKAVVERGRRGILASNAEDDASRGCTDSPRLPMLHQQLLFRKEPSLPLDKILQRSFESESLGFAEKRKTSDDDVRTKERASFSSPRGVIKTHTPYFDPKLGYRTRSRSPKMQSEDIATGRRVPPSSEMHKTASITVTPPSADDKKEEVSPPPAVQPKPKISIHKDKEGNIVKVSPAMEAKSNSPEGTISSEKQNSLGRMGKAGRDWIRKKLSFIDRKPDEQPDEDRSQGTPGHPKKKGKLKARQRSSSLLRSKRVSLRSMSSTEESSDGEFRKRDSFLRRPRRKGKSPGNSKSPSPAKSKPKKYTRSKTEGSPNDMRNFLAKFKASQSNPNKPSVLKQFEMKLLENEVKTLSDENTGKAFPRKHDAQRSHVPVKPLTTYHRSADGYLSGEADDGGDPLLLAPGIDENAAQSNVNVRSKSPRALSVKPKTHFRKSMTDFRPSPGSGDNWMTRRRNPVDVASPRRTNNEAVELCGSEGVSKLVNRFSSHLDDGLLGVAKPIQQRPALRTSFRHPRAEKMGSDSQGFQRSYSLSSRDGNPQRTRFAASVPIDASSIDENPSDSRSKTLEKQKARGVSWRDRVIATPETDTSETLSVASSLAPSQGQVSQRVSAPPGQFDSLSSFWESERPAIDAEDAYTSSNLGRTKQMSEEMKKKADMLEQALSKGPRKPRRYRRAETQPVHSNFGSTSDEDTLTDTEDVLDVAFRPFLKDFEKTNYAEKEDEADFDSSLAGPSQMHPTIPPVTGKFSKPTKPAGRLPSRWAR